MFSQPTQTKLLSADGFQWNQYSPRVATISNETKYFATVAYFAFNTWDEAHKFQKHLTGQEAKPTSFKGGM